MTTPDHEVLDLREELERLRGRVFMSYRGETITCTDVHLLERIRKLLEVDDREAGR